MKFADKLLQRAASPQIYNIIRIGDADYSKLAKQTMQLQKQSERTKTIIQSLKMTAANENAISLSCPQIGMQQAIFVMLKSIQRNIWRYDNVTPNDYDAYINPQKIKESQLQQVEWEECASYPFLMGKIVRSQMIIVQYRNENWDSIQVEEHDFKARIIQHEIDHLNGKTINDVGITLIESKRESFQSADINLDNLKRQQQGITAAMMRAKVDQSKQR